MKLWCEEHREIPPLDEPIVVRLYQSRRLKLEGRTTIESEGTPLYQVRLFEMTAATAVPILKYRTYCEE